MRSSFCILRVFGDVLDEGEPDFLGTAQTFEAAKRRADALAEFWPGQYVIYDQQTGNRFSVETPAKVDRKKPAMEVQAPRKYS